jgi:hypothetical protein
MVSDILIFNNSWHIVLGIESTFYTELMVVGKVSRLLESLITSLNSALSLQVLMRFIFQIDRLRELLVTFIFWN